MVSRSNVVLLEYLDVVVVKVGLDHFTRGIGKFGFRTPDRIVSPFFVCLQRTFGCVRIKVVIVHTTKGILKLGTRIPSYIASKRNLNERL